MAFIPQLNKSWNLCKFKVLHVSVSKVQYSLLFLVEDMCRLVLLIQFITTHGYKLVLF